MIEELRPPLSDADVRGLALLLLDAVDSGASVSFLAGLDLPTAEAYWRATAENMGGRSILLVTRDSLGIAGSVQLRDACAPNQPHRGDIAKLLVHRRARRQGVGSALMTAIETAALRNGITLLVLDTKVGEAAERLYERHGWQRVSVVPRYALNPDGSFCDTVFFYKSLRRNDSE